MKRFGKIVAILLVVMILSALTLCACTEKSVLVLNYNEATGGKTQSTVSVTKGQPVGELPTPTRENHIFVGWYFGDTEIDEDTIWQTDGSAMIFAKWQYIPPVVDDFEDYGMPVIDIDLSKINVVESGKYNTMKEVGAYIYLFHKLPSNYNTSSKYVKSNYTASNKLSYGGATFQNREGLLPKKSGRTFTECDIEYRGGNRNAKRIVFSNDWLIFYTSDHYESFSILRIHE